MQTLDEALVALKRGDPIHVGADEIHRFLALMDSRKPTGGTA